MRKIKHIWNAAFVAAAITATTIPSVCACSLKTSTPTLKTINIDLPKDSFSVQEYRTITSQPIEVECLDDKDKPIETELEWVIVEEGGSIPNWINVNANNQLVIEASVEISFYRFNIYAQDKQTQTIKSEIKTFTVEIHGSPLVPPEDVEVENTTGKDMFFINESTPIKLVAKGSREGYQPEEVSGECKWMVMGITGKKVVDFDNQLIFKLNYDENECRVTLSTRIDSTYLGEYTLRVRAQSIYSVVVYDDYTFNITVSDGKRYVDATSGCVLTRNSFNESWTISSLIEGTKVIANLPDLVYDYPITKVGKNLCSMSDAIDLNEVILPTSVVEIEDNAFANQTNLTKIAMPGVKYIGKEAFKNCTNVNWNIEYEQPKLRYVGAKAFYFCNKLTLDSVNEFYYIGEFAFCNTGIKSINIGSYISYIDTDAFTSCSSLNEIIIANEIPPKLGGVLYYGSTNPQTIKVPLSAINNYLASPEWAPYTDLLVGF